MKKLFILLMIPFLFIGCEKDLYEEPYDDTPSVDMSPRSYAVRIGTYFYARGAVMTPEEGSVIFKTNSGSLFIPPKASITAAGTITYTIRGPQGGTRSQEAGFTEVFNLDDFGDFYVDFRLETGPGERVVSINAVDMTMTSYLDGVVYEKEFYISDSIWDAGKLAKAAYEYEVSDYGQMKWPSGTYSRYFDINGDIILEQK